MPTDSCSQTPQPTGRQSASPPLRRFGRTIFVVIVVVLVVSALADEPATTAVAGLAQAMAALLIAWRSRMPMLVPRP
jgi:hypothetical protein